MNGVSSGFHRITARITVRQKLITLRKIFNHATLEITSHAVKMTPVSLFGVVQESPPRY
jgi:hypothetical protein